MKCFVKPLVVYILCASLLLTHSAQAFLREDAPRVRVAFLGVKFDDVHPALQRKILADLLRLMEEKRELDVLAPPHVADLIGSERVERLVQGMHSDSLLAVGTELNADYVFTGVLANTSRDSSRIVLAGSVNRYDRATKKSYTLEILRLVKNPQEFYEFREDLRKIDDEFILTILPKEGGSSIVPMLIIGAIALVGIIALLLGTGKAGGQGDLPSDPVVQ